MRKPIRLTTPGPTLEELEKRFRISKTRKKELQVIVDQFRAELALQDDAQVNPATADESPKSASAA